MMVEIIRRFHCDPITENSLIQTLKSNEEYRKISETTTSVIFENVDRYCSNSVKMEVEEE